MTSHPNLSHARSRFMQHDTMFRIPTWDMAANGSTSADAAKLQEGFNLVSAADDAKGVILPVGAEGSICIVKSTVSAKVLKVYPDSGKKINGGSADAALSMNALGAQFFVKKGDGWWSVPLNAIDPSGS